MYTRRALEGKALLEAELGLRRQVHGQRHRGHERPREGDLREDRERLVEEGGRRGDAVGEALLLDLPLRRRAVGAEERRDAEARRSVEVEVELELGPRLGLERRGDVGAVPVEGRVDVEAQALDALGPRLPGGREHDGRRGHGHGHQFEQLGRRRLGVDGEGRVVAVLEVADGRGDERLGRLAHRVAERELRLEAGPLRGHVQRLGREGRVGEVVGAAEGHLAREEVPVLVHDGVQAQGQPAGARLHGHLGLAGGRARHGKHERGGEALHRASLLVRASWVASRAARSIFQLRREWRRVAASASRR
mmetsp:Transcript_7932/g.27173  ORF Transcript_7932/g.27173 Transcript_7932/m.27173 type:complete len:306 (+) Transcript_7932:34-951(+)